MSEHHVRANNEHSVFGCAAAEDVHGRTVITAQKDAALTSVVRP